MKSVAVGTVLLASLLAVPAFAADLPVKARPYQQQPIFTPSWTGFYIGGQVGYAHGDWGSSPLFADIGPFVTGVPVGKTSGDGITGGLHVGYNYQMSNWVVGVEADFNWPSINNNSSTALNPGTFLALAYNTAAKVDHYGTVRARLGYAAMPNTLLYVTGGWAYGETKTDITGYDVFSGGVPFTTSSSQTHSGWTVGAGVNYMLTANWILGAEYKHIDLGSETFNYIFPAFGGTVVTGTRDLKIDEVTARVAYKF
jgi:outer membrane immunogenic protein